MLIDDFHHSSQRILAKSLTGCAGICIVSPQLTGRLGHGVPPSQLLCRHPRCHDE